MAPWKPEWCSRGQSAHVNTLEHAGQQPEGSRLNGAGYGNIHTHLSELLTRGPLVTESNEETLQRVKAYMIIRYNITLPLKVRHGPVVREVLRGRFS